MTTQYTRPVASIRGESGAICGSGWLALGRYVVTCAHVLNDALKRPRDTTERPEGPFRLDLPFLGKTGLSGRVVAWFPVRPLAELVRDPLADVAVIELEEGKEFSGGIEPLAVDRRIPPRGTEFLTYGFPVGFDNGVEASGEVLVKDPGGWLQVRDTQAFGYFIQPGFSGAPVVSQTDLRLIGMATAADRDKTTRLAFLLPAQLICRALPLLANPYRGLSAFGEEDADLFFGRESFVTELQTKLERHPFAAVIGPSGSGKSSVVLAGLAPKLLAQGWNVAVCRPLRDSLFQLGLGLASLTNPNPADFSARNKEAEEWAARLRNDPGRIVDLARQIGGTTPGRQTRTLLIIDQFEELFTQDAEAPDGAVARKAETTDENGSPRQAQFLAVIEAIAKQDPYSPPIRAVATMRADFMGHALAIRRLAALLQDTDVKLGPMTAAELSEAVRRPALTFGVKFEDGLAVELVTAMQGRAGGLPLLQFALDRLWRQQQGCRLTWAAYRGSDGKGGLETALNEHAEGEVRRLGGGAEASVRRLMLRLVRLGEDGAPDTRAVARRREIGEADWPLVQKLADERSRLLTLGRDPATGEETAEVVHEALIGAWGRLQGWLQEDRAFGLWRQRLKEGLQAWTASPEDRDLLLRGRQLSEASTWVDSRGNDLNDAERAFIKASQDHARQEAEEELNQALERERLANELAKAAQESERRAQELVAAAQEREQLARELAAAAQESETRAETARLLAEAAAREAKGRQLGAEAVGIARDLQGAESAELAAALAIEGWRRFPTAAAHQAAVISLRELPQYRIEHGSPVKAVAFSPIGDLLATGCGDGVRLIRSADGKELARVENGGAVKAVAFSPNGALLATGSEDGSARLIRSADGKEVARIEHGSPVNVVAFSPQGDLFATGSDDNSARLIRTDGKEAAHIEHAAPVTAIAFSPNGDLLATVSAGSARLIRTTDGSEAARTCSSMPSAIAFSPNGDLLAIVTLDGSARLIRTADGEEVARVEHGAVVTAVAFSPKGDFLATGSWEGARLLRTTDGSEAARTGHGDLVTMVSAVAFNPNGDLLATVGGNALRLIRTSDGNEVARIEHGDLVKAVAFTPKGDLLATGSDDGSARLIRAADDHEVARIEH
ncbi:trypsin-like peptidase domain-containing protein, partial [Mesorhizobium sp. B2-8-3]|uniref:nSTAND1 domain-containing NTPase n=1 Tax=Mesorhizobium sp. B2-8-3 TaxID=2589905 RepID=UPI0015E2C9BB